MKELTINRILTELKTIDDRINKKIDSMRTLCIKRGSYGILDENGNRRFTSEDEFINKSKSDYQSVNDLINRKFKLRSSLIKANNSTKVSINGVEYTISEAIEMKSILELKKSLLNKLKSDFTKYRDTFTFVSEKVESEFEKALSAQLPSGVDKSQIEDIRKDFYDIYRKQNEVSVVDPIHIEKEIESLEDEISSFMMEIDFSLSSVNSTTLVEVED